MNRRGVILITCYMVIAALTVLGAAFLLRSVSERSIAGKYFDSTQAFWLAEAGINKAIFQLRKNYNNLDPIESASLGAGQYDVAIAETTSGGIVYRVLTATGSVSSIQRVVEATVQKHIPDGFYDHVIWASGDLERKGDVVGDVIYANPEDINGPGNTYKNQVDRDADPEENSEVQDSTINPLPLLAFDQIQALSEDQGWYDPDTGVTTFPDTFWNVPPDPEIEGDPGTPNVVFVNGDWTLSGNVQVAGFIVVGGGGEVVFDATISGTALVDGCVYTRGNLTNNGGGSVDFNIKGIWVGGTTTLGGSSVLTYDEDYMNAIKGLNINADVQISSWRETQATY